MAKTFKKSLALALVLAFVLQLFVMAPFSAQAASKRGTFLANYSTIEREADNSFMMTSTSGQKVRVIFYSETVFRIWSGVGTNAPADAVYRNGTVIGGTQGQTPMLVDFDLGSAPMIELSFDTEDIGDSTYALFKSAALTLKATKTSNGTVFTLTTADGGLVWEEDTPIDFGAGTNNYTYQTLKMHDGEQYFGGGVQQGNYVWRGRTMSITKGGWVENQCSNGAPFFISTNGFAAFRNTFGPGQYDFTESASKNYADLRHTGNSFDCFYFYGDIPTVIDDYTEVTGKPTIMPRWALGLGEFNIYTKMQDGQQVVDTMLVLPLVDRWLAEDMPVSHFVVNDGYRPAGDRGYTQLPEVVQELKDRGIKTGLWTSQGLESIDWEVKTAGIRLQKLDVGWVGPGYDFTLNANRQAFEGIENNSNARAYVITCCGWAGSQRYATTWTGDQTSDWTYTRYHIQTFASAGLSGMPLTTSDLDAIFGGSAGTYTRDLQFKTFTTNTFIMSGWSSTFKQPWWYGEPYTSINRKYLKLRQALTPYLYSYNFQAGIDATLFVRPMFYEFPNNPNVKGDILTTQYQFMSGDYLLVAPVYSNTTIRNGIYLPEGRWTDYFTGKYYYGSDVYADGVIDGYRAPMDAIPVFVRAGGIIPTYPTYEYKNDVIPDLINFDIYPEGKSDFTLYEDDGSSQEYRNGEYLTTIITSDAPNAGETGTVTVTIGKAEGKAHEAMPEARKVTLGVNMRKKPTAVKLDDAALTEYDSLAALQAAGQGWFFDPTAKLGTLYVYAASSSIYTEKIFTMEGVSIAKNTQKTETLAAPAQASVVGVSPTQVMATWDAVPSATGYDLMVNGSLYRDVDDTAFVLSYLTAAASPALQSFQVRAFNDEEVSPWSATFSGRALANYPSQLIARANWKAVGPVAPATNLINLLKDNNTDTFYYTEEQGAVDFNFNQQYPIRQVRYLPRTDVVNGGKGTILGYKLSYSPDGTNFYPIAGGTGTWDKSIVEKTATFQTVLARAIRLEVTDSVGGAIAINEMNFIQDATAVTLTEFAQGKPISASSEWVVSENTTYAPILTLSASGSSTATGSSAANAVDGKSDTVWTSNTTAASDTLTVTLGNTYYVGQVTVLPPATGGITKYDISILPPGTGATYQVVAGGVWADDGQLKTVQFRATQATAVRITGYSGTGKASAVAEVKVYAQTEGAAVPYQYKVDKEFKGSVSSQMSGNPGSMLFDGIYSNYWDSNYGSPKFPEYIQIEMIEPSIINQLVYWPRTSSTNGQVIKYDLMVSDTGLDGSWTCVGSGEWPGVSDKSGRVAVLPPDLGPVKFLRLQATDSTYVYATGHMCGAELEVFGTGPATLPPPIVIADTLKPGTDYTYSASSQVSSNPISYVFDGSTSTYWDSNYTSETFPQWIQMDLIIPMELSALYYTPRQDGRNGTLMKYNLYKGESADGPWTSIATGDWANSAAKKTLDMKGLGQVQFLRLQADTRDSVPDAGVNNRHLCAAEVELVAAERIEGFTGLGTPEAAVPVEGNFSAAYINDGLTYTAWSSDADPAQEVIIDLEQTVQVMRMNLTWAKYSAFGIEYYASTDGVNWTKIYGGNDTVAYVDAYARYIKLVTNGSSFGNGVMISDLKVWGLAVPKTALLAAIADFEALPGGENFTAATYASALAAYNAAKPFEDDVRATANAVNAVATALRTALNNLKFVDIANLKLVVPTNITVKKGTTYKLNLNWTPDGVKLPNLSVATTAPTTVNVAIASNAPGAAVVNVNGLKVGSAVVQIKANDGSGAVAAVIVTVN